MPHVIVEGPASLERLYQNFKPDSIRDDGAIIKFQEMYLNTSKQTVLVDCVVVEDGLPQKFYALLTQKPPGITVRLDPMTDPQKTNGVKRLVAILGYRLKSQDPACRYGKHNLTGFLIDEL